jgi:hypothetical protein
MSDNVKFISELERLLNQKQMIMEILTIPPM